MCDDRTESKIQNHATRNVGGRGLALWKVIKVRTTLVLFGRRTFEYITIIVQNARTPRTIAYGTPIFVSLEFGNEQFWRHGSAGTYVLFGNGTQNYTCVLDSPFISCIVQTRQRRLGPLRVYETGKEKKKMERK